MNNSDYLNTKLGLIRIRQTSFNDALAFHSVLKNVSEWLKKQDSGQWVPGAVDNNISPIEDMVQDGNSYVAEYNDQIIATVRLVWELPNYWETPSQNVGYLSTLYVHRDFASNGIGSSIINWSENKMRHSNKDYSCLDCYAQNTTLCSYYQNTGYQYVNMVETYPGYNQRLYRKYL